MPQAETGQAEHQYTSKEAACLVGSHLAHVLAPQNRWDLNARTQPIGAIRPVRTAERLGWFTAGLFGRVEEDLVLRAGAVRDA